MSRSTFRRMRIPMMGQTIMSVALLGLVGPTASLARHPSSGSARPTPAQEGHHKGVATVGRSNQGERDRIVQVWDRNHVSLALLDKKLEVGPTWDCIGFRDKEEWN